MVQVNITNLIALLLDSGVEQECPSFFQISHVLRTATALFLQSKGKFCATSFNIGYDCFCCSE